jgi:hypothetical protein
MSEKPLGVIYNAVTDTKTEDYSAQIVLKK